MLVKHLPQTLPPWGTLAWKTSVRVLGSTALGRRRVQCADPAAAQAPQQMRMGGARPLLTAPGIPRPQASCDLLLAMRGAENLAGPRGLSGFQHHHLLSQFLRVRNLGMVQWSCGSGSLNGEGELGVALESLQGRRYLT